MDGTNDMSNLIYICPNCHRAIHQLGSHYITNEQLYLLSLDKILPNWLDFYNPTRLLNKSLERSPKKCLYDNCNNMINTNSIYCSLECSGKHHYKFAWSKEILIDLLTRHNGILTSISKEINISDNAIKKQCNKFALNIQEFKTKYKRV